MKRRDKGRRAQRQIPFWVGSDNEEEEAEGEQGEETIPKQGKAASVAEALADTQAELKAQSALPSAGKESGTDSADSAKLQSDGALNGVIKWIEGLECWLEEEVGRVGGETQIHKSTILKWNFEQCIFE